jgi:hypothetical protein
MRLAGLLRPSRPEEFTPESLTDPDLPPSRHSARATARRLPPSIEHQPPSDLSGGDLPLACARFTTTPVPGLPQLPRASSDHASVRVPQISELGASPGAQHSEMLATSIQLSRNRRNRWRVFSSKASSARAAQWSALCSASLLEKTITRLLCSSPSNLENCPDHAVCL